MTTDQTMPQITIYKFPAGWSPGNCDICHTQQVVLTRADHPTVCVMCLHPTSPVLRLEVIYDQFCIGCANGYSSLGELTKSQAVMSCHNKRGAKILPSTSSCSHYETR